MKTVIAIFYYLEIKSRLVYVYFLFLYMSIFHIVTHYMPLQNQPEYFVFFKRNLQISNSYKVSQFLFNRIGYKQYFDRIMEVLITYFFCSRGTRGRC